MKNSLCTCLVFIMLARPTYSQAPTGEKRLPDEAQRLKSAYQQSVERAVEPLRKRYIADLTRVLDATTKAGRLDDALAIKAELATIKKPSSTFEFKNTHWDFFNSNNPGVFMSWIELLDGGGAKDSWKSSLKWHLDGKFLILTQGDGRTWRFEMDPTNLEGRTHPDTHNKEAITIRFSRTLP